MSIRLLSLGFSIIFCGVVSAEEPVDRGIPTDDILVTASRSPMARVNVGSSTTVISRDQIEHQQARYVTDLLRAVPGFSVSQSGTFGSQTQVRVRGAEANHVLVLIDGVRANDPASGDEFRWEFLSTSNVERIEIVRGPQSSLWGSDAVSAVVNVITRGGSGRRDIGAYAEGGTFDTLNAGLQGGAAGDNWSLAFGLERLDTDGSNISRSGSEKDDSRLNTFSMSGNVRPTANLEFNFGVRALQSWAQYDPIDFVVTGLPMDGDVATDSEQASAQLGIVLATLEQRLVHRLNIRYLDTDNRSLTDHIEDSSTASDRLTVSYQSDIRLQENLLSLAIEHERTRFEQRGDATFGDPNQDQEIDVSSFVADFQGRSFGPLTWLLSGRYDNYSDFDDAVTGRLALAYEINDTIRLRASVGTGQKAPTFIERFGFFPGEFVGNSGLKPETSTSFDLGLDQSLMGDMLELQLTYFNQDLQDEINGFVFDPDTFLFTAANVDGKSSRSGIELGAVFRPNDVLELGGSYTYTDSEEENDQGQNVEELRRPQHTGSVHANLQLLDGRANVLLVADYGGDRSDLFFPPFPAPSETVTLDSYWLLGLTVAYDVSRSLNVFVRASNLLDKQYEEVYGFRTPGRAAYLGMRVAFGH